MRRWLAGRLRDLAARVDDPLGFGGKMPDAGGAVRAAVGFVQVWARPRAGWHAAVRVLVTPELAVALDATDPGSLPDADPTGAPEVRSLAGDSAMVSGQIPAWTAAWWRAQSIARLQPLW